MNQAAFAWSRTRGLHDRMSLYMSHQVWLQNARSSRLPASAVTFFDQPGSRSRRNHNDHKQQLQVVLCSALAFLADEHKAATHQ